MCRLGESGAVAARGGGLLEDVDVDVDFDDWEDFDVVADLDLVVEAEAEAEADAAAWACRTVGRAAGARDAVALRVVEVPLMP